MYRRLALVATTLAAVSLQGCAVYQVPLRGTAGAASPASAQAPTPGLSIGELLQMLQAKRPQEDIITDLRSRGLRVAPAPADYDVLSAAGAGPDLLQSLQTAAAYASAQISQGGVPQGPIVQDPYLYYDATYPWVPFGLGLGFGYSGAWRGFWGSSGYWGHPFYRGYAPIRPYGGFVAPHVVPRGGAGMFSKPIPGGGFMSKGRR